jgi:hypothetical protein
VLGYKEHCSLTGLNARESNSLNSLFLSTLQQQQMADAGRKQLEQMHQQIQVCVWRKKAAFDFVISCRGE